MREEQIERITNETAFTMWVEGFVMPEAELTTIRRVLSGEIPFQYS